MSFRSYKKELDKKRDEQNVINMLNFTVDTLQRRRDEYAEKAKNELRCGNKSQYEAYVALLKNVMFNIAQTKDMLANFLIARDLREMQSLSKDFVKAINSVMKDVFKTSKLIRVASSQKLFNKALYKQNYTASELQQLLKDNKVTFVSSVSTLSDISDTEIKSLLEMEIKKDDRDIDDMLAKLEKEFSVNSLPTKIVEGISNNENANLSSVVDTPKQLEKSQEENRNDMNSGDEPSENKKTPTQKQEPESKIDFTYSGDYVFPTLDLLVDAQQNAATRACNERDINEIKTVLENKLKEFDIEAKTENYIIGATYSRLELKLLSNTLLSQIAKIEKDIAMALKRTVRLLLPIEGKDLIGVEVENAVREIIPIKTLLESPQAQSRQGKADIGLGLDIEYKPRFKTFDSFPHLLIGGTTGSGKSCFLHSMITEIFYRYTPSELRLILVDFKRVEMGMYNGLPHLVGGKVVDEYEDVALILENLSNEMDRRYKMFLQKGVRDIAEFNSKCDNRDKLPTILTIVDEYGDIVGSKFEKTIEQYLQRLAQKARACGIHLIVSTQRPSVKVINGVIKANFPTRIAFSVASHIDSMNILDCSGAEDLIGKGDMLFSCCGKVERLQTPYVSLDEINSVADFIRKNNTK